MNAKISNREATRTQLLQSGMELILEQGYNNTGLQEILDRTRVPKGSFYYYFDSKEDFALNIIDYFNNTQSNKILECLSDKALSPAQRLRKYCECNKRAIEESRCCKGCLIGNLSQEMADQSEVLRKRLEQTMSHWRDLFAECIAEGQAAGEISTTSSARDLAELFLSGWEGAVLRAKSTKTPEPMEIFMRVMFDRILGDG